MPKALKAYTLHGTYACNRENKIRGSLKPGKLSDITVIDRNIVRNNPEDVINMVIITTIVNGKIVYKK
jgi:predicted amidohydrolase YtcJ